MSQVMAKFKLRILDPEYVLFLINSDHLDESSLGLA